jgi:hypothetical protein
MLFHPVVQVRLRRVIAVGDKLLGRALGQQRLDFWPEGIQLILPSPFGLPSLTPAAVCVCSTSLVHCEISSRSISAAMANAMARILLWRLMAGGDVPALHQKLGALVRMCADPGAVSHERAGDRRGSLSISVDQCFWHNDGTVIVILERWGVLRHQHVPVSQLTHSARGALTRQDHPVRVNVSRQSSAAHTLRASGCHRQGERR